MAGRDKRKNEMIESSSTSKKMKYNIWAKEDEILLKELSELVIGKSKNQGFRVCYKSELKNITTGSMFTFHLFDGTIEISGAAFSPEAERFYDQIQFDKVYQLEHFKVRKQPPQYAFKDAELQVVLDSNSNVSEINVDIPKFKFTFNSIESIQLLQKHSQCDYLGVFFKDWGLETTTNEKVKRDLSFTDKSKETIIITLWGKRAENFIGKENQIFAIRCGFVSEFGDTKYINIFSKTLLWTDPDISEAVDLKNWYLTEIKNL